AAAGTLAAGFYLPLAIGFRRTYLLAVAVNVVIGVTACLLATTFTPDPFDRREAAVPKARANARPRSPRDLLGLAAASGFLTLGLEIAAMRLFAQILQNSVYTISAILIVFLAGLGAGALLAARLSSATTAARTVLRSLLTASGF